MTIAHEHLDETVDVDPPPPAAPAAAPPGVEAAPDQDPLPAAVRHEFDQVLPHVVAALKRHDGVTELRRRLDEAEKRLADREQRPLVAGLRRVLAIVRRLDFDPAAKEAIASELERVLVGAGYQEFGEVGETFDPQRHEAVTGEASEGSAVVTELLEPGLETLGEVVARAKVGVGSAGEAQ
ncbi:MAG: nucleotide exchange factor GrpE [Solirubrobacterales bacterium]